MLTAKASNNLIYYQEACRYWVKAILGLPYFRRNGEKISPPHGRYLYFNSSEAAAFTTCLMNSSLFYWFYSAFSDGEHLNDNLVRGFRIPENWKGYGWQGICEELMADLNRCAQRKTIRTKQGHVIEYDEIKALKVKQRIDEVDRALAELYAFDAVETDFITSYDIKYRMGQDIEEDEEL